MSKFQWSSVPRRGLVWGALGLLVFALLAWKLGVDYVAARQAESGGKEPFSVTGFRSANFGDDETAVRAAIAKDFNLEGDAVRVVESPLEKTGLLAVRVRDVIPDSGDAEIVYILGYKSKQLIQVNIVWGTRITPGIQPARIGATATTLGNYFAAQGFVPTSVTINEKLPTGAVRVFAGEDTQGRKVDLLYQEALLKPKPDADKPDADKPQAGKAEKTGKPAEKKAAAAPAASAEPAQKLVALRLSYIKDVVEPDIYKIEKGQF
ncbi:MAG: hypothetical protein K8R18_02775 [Parvibaculum sp.]|uniref:hypothetical protein n=1 Tax=Parvibaculum sp. TaxID=2024848 RepID=UPI0025FABF01|nr:hypothetical protein [Parvibaculum sp.]MCE9648526.1 hypothetical protein [Parvibaculum sp.]